MTDERCDMIAGVPAELEPAENREAVVSHGVQTAAGADPAVLAGVTTVAGSCTQPDVAEALGVPWRDRLEVLSR